MGGTIFEQTEFGLNVKDVFNDIVDEALHLYGRHENGTISTTNLGRQMDYSTYLKLQKAYNEKDFDTIYTIENIFYNEKRVSNYIKELSHFEAFSPNWINVDVDKKGKQMKKLFAVLSKSQYEKGYRPMIRYTTLSEAKKIGKEMSLNQGTDVVILQYYTFKGESQEQRVPVGKFILVSDGKKLKTERKLKTKKCLPVFKFTFFVYAAS